MSVWALLFPPIYTSRRHSSSRCRYRCGDRITPRLHTLAVDRPKFCRAYAAPDMCWCHFITRRAAETYRFFSSDLGDDYCRTQTRIQTPRIIYHMTTTTEPTQGETDAGNGSKAICRVSNVLRSPSPDPRLSCAKLLSCQAFCPKNNV